ncbi:NAD(P)-binding protein [Periconia macrospinosa]|uniref:NAD(P)-binding protein n=1 Tax=Periconia macrospinosa TaxID=97972 RepID=A0A2V1D7C5_9PLEO|nr:NAD(P)-binding protein [Periconia macrospinosa]
MPSAYEIRSPTSYPWKSGNGGNNLHLNPNVPKPTSIPAGHVLVNIKAAAFAPRDVMIISQDPIYPSYTQDGLTPLQTKGEQGWQGTLREYGVFLSKELIHAPSYLPYTSLASLASSAGTAAHAFFYGPRRLRAGQTVLTQGTGGVSLFALQIAAAAGATVIVTSSSNQKLETARSLGAMHTINYVETPAWEDEVLRLTDGKGVDFVIEIGGSGSLMQSIKAARHGGLICLVGFLTESVTYDIIAPVLFTGKTIYGVRSFAKEHVEYGVKVLAEKKVEPAVGKVFGWSEEEVREAVRTLAKWDVVGKIVVKVGEE